MLATNEDDKEFIRYFANASMLPTFPASNIQFTSRVTVFKVNKNTSFSVIKETTALFKNNK